MTRRLLPLALLCFTLLAAASGFAQAPRVRVVRSLPTAAKPGDVIGVALAVRVPEGADSGVVHVTEQPPAGWELTDITPPAQWNGEALEWSLPSQPGVPLLLSYAARLPLHVSGVGIFKGQGSAQATGQTFTTDGAEIVPIGSSINVMGFALNTWEMIGILGALIFASRFLVQWIASERRRKSVVPVSFWWLSLVGTTILTLYGIHFRRLAVVLGQAFGFVVYIRNLQLIASHGRAKRDQMGLGEGEAP
jgi:lipid-A-disaccharide synthase-like uncharacterized protein